MTRTIARDRDALVSVCTLLAAVVGFEFVTFPCQRLIIPLRPRSTEGLPCAAADRT